MEQAMSLPIKLLSTDFDGTLHADFENPPVPLHLQEAIASLQRQGAHWLINTGRDLSSLMESLARARLSVWPDYLGLVEREIYIRVGHEYHPLGTWNADCAKAHATLFAQIANDLPRLYQWIEERHEAKLYEDPFSPLCLIAASNAEADAIMVYLEDYCATIPDLTVVRNDIYARFSHANYHKGHVMAAVARHLGVGPNEILAAGDHLNDLPMLDGVHARMVCAPGNAVPQVTQLVRKVGGFLSDKPCGHGVAEALQHFLNQSPTALTSQTTFR